MHYKFWITPRGPNKILAARSDHRSQDHFKRDDQPSWSWVRMIDDGARKITSGVSGRGRGRVSRPFSGSAR